MGLKICTLHCNVICLKLYFFSRNFTPCRTFLSVMFMSCIFMSGIFMSCNFMSCNFMSCKLVRHFHVLLFHAVHIGPSISRPAISCPAILMVRPFHVQHFQSNSPQVCSFVSVYCMNFVIFCVSPLNYFLVVSCPFSHQILVTPLPPTANFSQILPHFPSLWRLV